MQALNLPAINARIRTQNGRHEILDPVRKQYVAHTPEEWVRQHLIAFLIHDRKVPEGLIAVEKQITVNQLSKRCDIVVYNPSGNPVMVVECKSPSVKISKETYNQAVRYNLSLNIRYMLLSNGLSHFCFKLDYQDHKSIQLDYIPVFQELSGINP